MSELICKNCGLKVDPSDQKFWRWSSWAASGNPATAPQRPKFTKIDEWDFVFHKQCFPEWIENRNAFLQDLDQPMNNCKFFERTGSSMHGYYIRDGKKHPCMASWTNYDISGQSIFLLPPVETKLDFAFVQINISDQQAFLRSFLVFLQKHGWYNDGWFEPRREFIIKDAVKNKMLAQQNQ